MNSRAIRSMFCIFFFIASLKPALAQHEHFVYIQTENRQAFYLLYNNKVHSSTTSGYVIIPKLLAGNYTFRIGFPNDEWPAHDLSISVKSDQGFLLKNIGNNSWGLFNTQTMELLKGTAVTSQKTEATASGNQFSDALASVTNSPPMKISAPVTTAPAKKNDTASVREPEIVKTPATTAAAEDVQIRKILDLADNSGRSLAYVVMVDAKPDTVRLFIPGNDKLIIVDSPVSKLPNDSSVRKHESASVITDVKVSDAGTGNTASVDVINGNCNSIAGTNDLKKLRRKISSENDAEGRLAAAKKAFRSKCYSTAQVRELGALFMTDAERYAFFDAAYPGTSDRANFGILVADLREEYYINRFRAMLR